MEKKLNYKLFNILFNIIVVLSVIVILYTATVFFVAQRNMGIKRKSYTDEQYKVVLEYLQNEIDEIPLVTKKEFKKIVEKDLHLWLYSYKEKDEIGKDMVGLSNLITRTISIDKSLPVERWYQVFVHEAIHVTQCTKNESYTCIATFKYLYEHENKTLRNAGIYYGIEVLMGCFSRFYEYDIKDLIVEYLIDKGVINGKI